MPPSRHPHRQGNASLARRTSPVILSDREISLSELGGDFLNPVIGRTIYGPSYDDIDVTKVTEQLSKLSLEELAAARDAFIRTRTILSPVVKAPTTRAPADLLSEVTRPSKSPDKTEVPPVEPVKIPRPAAVMPSPSTEVGGLRRTQTTITEDISMDLGSIASGLLEAAGSAYINRELGFAPNAAAPVQQTPASPWPGTGIPAGFDEFRGTRVKRRRRRRRLATASDIRDLASLKAVLGNGEAFKTWIATHPS